MSSYRPNVAAVFQRSSGDILVCERLNTPGAWQFPQGGIDKGESSLQAVKREVEEEVAFTPDMYDIETSRGPYRYDYPPDVCALKSVRHPGFVGQEQEYFLCLMKDDSAEPDLARKHPEFARHKWIKPEEFKIEWLPDFKKDVYRRVFLDLFHITLS